MADYLSIADIERELKVARHRLNYAIRRHGPEPTSRIGIVRLWSRDQLPAIQRSVAQTDGRNAGQPGAEAVTA